MVGKEDIFGDLKKVIAATPTTAGVPFRMALMAIDQLTELAAGC